MDVVSGVDASGILQNTVLSFLDHVGVSNAQLVKEGVPIASKYNGRSVAEQNSLDLSWNLLMEPRFETFRSFIFSTPEEIVRFRQLVVNVRFYTITCLLVCYESCCDSCGDSDHTSPLGNCILPFFVSLSASCHAIKHQSVMSTDIVDKDMKALRNARWEKAFKKGESDSSNSDGDDLPVEKQSTKKKDEVNRKATIVIEHIIQASDICHTMQHWHVYRVRVVASSCSCV